MAGLDWEISRHVDAQFAGPGTDWRIVYGALFDEALEIVFRHDPIGLNLDDNTEKYWPEVAAILSRLNGTTTLEQVALLVYAVFIQYFSLETAGPPARYVPIARNLWSAWQRHRRQLALPPPDPAIEGK